MEAILGASSGCCLKAKLSQRMSQCDGAECLLRDELWLYSVERCRKMDEASLCGRCRAASQCLTWDLTQLGPSGTRQTNNTFSTNTQAHPSAAWQAVFLFSFSRVWDILRRMPVMPSRCHLRLPERRRALPAGSLDAASLLEPANTACSGLFHPAVSPPAPRWSCPDQLVELGSCRLPWTLIKYWCLALHAGWLTKEELYETEIERGYREDDCFKGSLQKRANCTLEPRCALTCIFKEKLYLTF